MGFESPGINEAYESSFPGSKSLYEKASALFPNGVTHDLRYFEPFPLYVERAKGSKKWDVDGREYIDYWSGHGALLLGHCSDDVTEAVARQVRMGTHFGACQEKEIEWAELVAGIVPSAQKIRFTGSGTEATLMCVRLARIFTGKNKVLKFAGHFHGWHDQVVPGVNFPYEKPVPGVVRDVADRTIICPSNDIPALKDILSGDDDIACAIIEPTGARFGTVPTGGDFLRQLRKVTAERGVVLVFDEVVSGFRVSPGGAQEYFNVLPDLTALAKILAGGLPGGAVTGRKDIMDLIEIREDEEWMLKKKMMHPGTFNANPVSAAAGIETLKAVKGGGPCRTATGRAVLLREGMNEAIDRHDLNWAVYGRFSEFLYVTGHDQDVLRARDFDPSVFDHGDSKYPENAGLKHTLRQGMLLNGVDSRTNGGLTMAAHTIEDIEKTVEAFDKTLVWMKRDGLI